MLDTIAHILISPINQSLLGFGFGLAILTFTNIKPWIGKVCIWFSVIWITLCSQYFFSALLIEPLERAFPPVKIENNQWKNADAIWVLACYHFDAEPLPLISQFNSCSIERLTQAAIMYKVKAIPIYLTGGSFNENTKLNHAEQASKLLVALGVNKLDIKIINKGQNTVSEAQELFKHIEEKKLAVISSATHGIRLNSILTNLDINFVFVPVHYASKIDPVFTINAPSIQALDRSERAFYEYGALIKYLLLH